MFRANSGFILNICRPGSLVGGGGVEKAPSPPLNTHFYEACKLKQSKLFKPAPFLSYSLRWIKYNISLVSSHFVVTLYIKVSLDKVGTYC